MYKKITHNITEEHFDHPDVIPVSVKSKAGMPTIVQPLKSKDGIYGKENPPKYEQDPTAIYIYEQLAQKLWTQQNEYSRSLMISTLASLEDANSIRARLMQNSEDIGAAIIRFYGKEAGATLTGLLKEHVSIANEIFKAIKESRNTAGLETAWAGNADLIATFLDSADPDNWQKAVVLSILTDQAASDLRQARARYAKDWTTGLAFTDAAYSATDAMAATFSNGIINKFPIAFVRYGVTVPVKKARYQSNAGDNKEYKNTTTGVPHRLTVDLRNWSSPVEDQGNLGSCEGNAIVSAYELIVRRLYPDNYKELSRLFVYYNSRWLDDTTMLDTGAYIADGMKATQKFGIATAQLWPYDITRFTVKPTDACYIDGLSRTITNYRQLDTIDDVLKALNDNIPVVIGIRVYDSFKLVSKYNPVVQSPTWRDYSTGGGHAMCLVGYDIPKKQFLVKNSHGTTWGEGGYGWIPFEYAEFEGFESWIFDISDPTLIK